MTVVFIHPLDVQQWQWADDALYKDNARSIFISLKELIIHQDAIQWLGEFSTVTLSKAPFFSVFIMLSHIFKIPFKLAEFLLYSPLPFLFWYAVKPLGLPKWPTLFLAAICLFFIPTSGIEVRLLRTLVFGAISLYCLTALCGLLIRYWKNEGRIWPWSLAAGVTMGLAATTREEAVWLIVPAVLTTLITVYISWQHKKQKALLLVIPYLILGFMIPGTFFSTLNYLSYEIYSPSLRQHSDFKELYSTLASLEPDQRQKYVPIGTATRIKAYDVSAHFAELKPFLEGPALDDIAKNKGHLTINGWGDRVEAREFFVSNFEFALSKAIFLSGRKDGESFLAFCRDTTEELNNAAERGEIKQGAKGIALLPPITTSDYEDIIIAAFKSIGFLVTAEGLNRSYLMEPNPEPHAEAIWHDYLGTWSVHQSGNIREISDYTFNKLLIPTLKFSYIPILVLSIICLIYLYRIKDKNFYFYFFMIMISASALTSFNTVMGVVDTIGWPILTWPNGYNILGFYPLHFLLLICLITTQGVISYIMKNDRMG